MIILKSNNIRSSAVFFCFWIIYIEIIDNILIYDIVHYDYAINIKLYTHTNNSYAN